MKLVLLLHYLNQRINMSKFLKILDHTVTAPFFLLGYVVCAIVTTFKYGGQRYINHVSKGWKL